MDTIKNRTEAGEKLSLLLSKYKDTDAIIYALPRGGVVVAEPIAHSLHLPLDLAITRKIGHPGNPEYAIGSVSEHGERCMNQSEVTSINKEYVETEIKKQIQEAHRRRLTYMPNKKPLNCDKKIAILVDDGIATGYTMKAAIQEVKTFCHPKHIVVAVGVVSNDTARELTQPGVEIVSLITDAHYFGSVGQYYQQFEQVEDSEVIRIMNSCSALKF